MSPAPDITSDLQRAVVPVVVENRAAITEQQKTGALFRSIDRYIGHPTTLIPLKLPPLVFVRPGELHTAEWIEIDLRAAKWRIPSQLSASRRARGTSCPPSTQALALVRELRSGTGKRKCLFPSLQSPNRPMSVNTVNDAGRRLRDFLNGNEDSLHVSAPTNHAVWGH